MKDKTSLFQQVTRQLAVKILVMMVIFTPCWAMEGQGNLKEKVRHHLLVFGPTATISDLVLYQDPIMPQHPSSADVVHEDLAEEALKGALKKYEVSLP